MFSGCPSVRLYVRPVLVIVLSEVPIDGFLGKLWSCMYLAEPMN